MDQLKDKKVICKVLKEAILQLCKAYIRSLNSSFTIDGIICISKDEIDDQEFVVKIHEKVEERVSSESIESVASQICDNNYAKNNSIGNNVTLQNNSSAVIAARTNPVIQNNIPSLGKKMPAIDDDDVEILDISTEKHLFDNFSDLLDFHDLSFNGVNDVVVKPDPGNFGKSMRNYTTPLNEEESSDEELKIETLKAGRVRKPNKVSYKDMHGASVQVLSKEEFKRILKSEKLKRSRDKSPDFVSAQKVLKTGYDNSLVHMKPLQQNSLQGVSMTPQVEAPKIIGNFSDSQNPHYRPSVSIVKQHHGISQGTGICQVQMSSNGGKQIQTYIQNDQSKGSISQVLPVGPQQVSSVPLKQQISSNTIKQRSDHVNSIDTSYVALGNYGGVFTTETSLNFTSQKPPIVSAPGQMNAKVLESQKTPQLFQTLQAVSQEQSHLQSVLSTAPSKLCRSKENDESDGTNSLKSQSVICLENVNETTRSRSHECPVCAEVFECFKHLDLHMYRMHPGMFICPVCGKLFKQRSTRNRHIVALHSTEKNFSCHLCGAAFTRSDTLKKHLNNYHPGTEIPKKSFSYSKGVASQPEMVELSSEQGNNILYENSVISPIQVTAAVEISDASLSDLPSNSTQNITNITPTGNNECSISSVVTRSDNTENSLPLPVQMLSTVNPENGGSVSGVQGDASKTAIQSVIAPSTMQIIEQSIANNLRAENNQIVINQSNPQPTSNPNEIVKIAQKAQKILGTIESLSKDTPLSHISNTHLDNDTNGRESLDSSSGNKKGESNQDAIKHTGLCEPVTVQTTNEETVSQPTTVGQTAEIISANIIDISRDEQPMEEDNCTASVPSVHNGSAIEISDDESTDLQNVNAEN